MSTNVLNIIAAPSFLPVTLDEMKGYLRVMHDQQDSMIEDLILVAVNQLYEDTSYPISRATFQYSMDEFTDKINVWNADILIYISNVNEITSFVYKNTSGDEIELSLNVDYDADLNSYPIRINLLNELTACETGYGNVKIEFTAGFDNEDDVPALAKQAIKYLVSHYYENPTPVISGTIVSTVPDTYTRVINSSMFKKI